MERPVQRFGLIEYALEPWPDRPDQLIRDLAVVISAESLFTLIDLCGLTPDDAVTSLVSTARRITETYRASP